MVFSFSSEQPALLCHSDERLALMQLKDSFIIDKQALANGSCAYPKAWISAVVAFYGSINSTSTLFRLVHLHKLNLAKNHFNYSVIPYALGNLSMLTSLNLSSSEFSGQIPSEISNLHRLSSLDLSYVDLASHIPSVLANLSSLTSLNLDSCGLQGMFPLAIFQLPKLETIWLVRNSDLKDFLVLPASIGNIDSLEYLGLGNCNFTGSVPSTWVPPTLGNLTKLYKLYLQSNHFTGVIPSELTNLTQLTFLDLQGNMLQGSVPSSISRLEKLNFFDCDYNRLGGLLEMDAFLELKDLQYLFLSLNDFNLVSRNDSNATGPQAQLLDIGLRTCHIV
ncbi:hypothetical protein GOBAR_AA09897 [Gossypium barbadense]|uniref:Leucine-rich repeat-containing N-terminal plant-type domain-containing protein n=1 Tax=Gossypium barbadense TaxID=3634 RepID=A0A2P5Y5C1_GOSBA|nr:hypothetical protein GOBAR_AA09897 [Gossypium barbadense]